MICRSLHDVSQQFVTADEIGYEYVRDKEGDEQEDEIFEQPFPDLLSVPWLTSQFPLLVAIAIYPKFNSSEYHFHKNGLRTNPSAEYPSKANGEQGHENNTYDHGDHEQMKILGPEWKTKNIEPAFQYIEHQELIAVNFNEGGRKQESQ